MDGIAAGRRVVCGVPPAILLPATSFQFGMSLACGPVGMCAGPAHALAILWAACDVTVTGRTARSVLVATIGWGHGFAGVPLCARLCVCVCVCARVFVCVRACVRVWLQGGLQSLAQVGRPTMQVARR